MRSKGEKSMKRFARKMVAVLLGTALMVTSAAPMYAAEEGDAPVQRAQMGANVRNEVYAAYADFLTMYKVAQDHRFYANDLSNPAVQNININLPAASGTRLSYTLVDLAQDGVPELFIAGNVDAPIIVNEYGWKTAGYVVYDTYGYGNGQAGRLFDDLGMGYRSNYHLMENNILLHSASGGAFNNVLEYYNMPANSRQPQMRQFIELDAFDGTVKWYLGTGDYANKEQISEATRNDIVNSYRYKKAITWYPIGDLSGLRTALKLDEIPIFLNGAELACDQSPVIVDGRALVPLRVIFEGLGATVDWDNATRTVTSTLDETTVVMTVGDGFMRKNGNAVALDVPAQIVNDRTMVPVRAVAEAFGAEVLWDNAARAVFVTR